MHERRQTYMDRKVHLHTYEPTDYTPTIDPSCPVGSAVRKKEEKNSLRADAAAAAGHLNQNNS